MRMLSKNPWPMFQLTKSTSPLNIIFRFLHLSIWGRETLTHTYRHRTTMKNSTPPLLRNLLASSLLILILFISSNVSADGEGDSINQTQTLKDGDTLVSSSDVYVLGFFQGGNGSSSAKTRYLGIWYTFSTDTVVWVANRQNPITDVASAALQLTTDGNLVIVQNDRQASNTSVPIVLWTSNSRGSTDKIVNPVAKLLDSGNLVITNGEEGDRMWQSFDYPSDTLLPGMKLGFDKITGQQWNTTSWKHENDPSLGESVCQMDAGESHEIFIAKGHEITFRAGIWNGRWLSGNPGMSTYDGNISYVYVDNQTTAFYRYQTNIGMYSRLKVFPNDSQMLFVWITNDTPRWMLYWREDSCDTYSRCGPNGVCDVQNLKFCDCFTGYRPKSNASWHSRDYSQGCERKEKLNCNSGENGFWLMENMKIPNTMKNSTIDKNITLDACKIRCSNDCSCVAYAPLRLSHAIPRGCILWFGDLIDTKQFGRDGQDIYLRLPISVIPKGTSSGSRNKTTRILITAAIGLIVLSLFGIIFWTRRKKKRYIRGGTEEIPNQYNIDNEKWKEEITLFDLPMISSATNNFANHKKIGQGGFGSVYKGTLTNGQEIAVKRLSNIFGQGLDEFMNEAMLIVKLQHRNLVRLLGCCMEGVERMLIYEFMPNKSLDVIIFGENKHILDWQKRAEIIIGISRGLLYLHQDSRLRIIHRDLKASNVLLDEVMNPKIADFGTARLFGSDQMEDSTRRVIGTYGYMSPEYMMNGIFSMKSDVFSFGVLLLEIISGKKNQVSFQCDQVFNLLDMSWRLCEDGKILELLDETLHRSCSISQVLHFMKIGLLCVQDLATDRPSMSDVVFMLSNENSHVPEAKRPVFWVGRMNNEVKSERVHPTSASSGQVSYTFNEMTITKLELR